MDAFLEVVKFFGAATFMDTYVGKEANAVIHQNGSSNWNFSILSNEPSVLQKFKLVLCNTVTCFRFQSRRTIYSNTWCIYDVLSNNSVWVLYQLKGIYCILQLKNFYFLKEHIIFIYNTKLYSINGVCSVFCKCLFFEQVYLFIPFINFDLALIYTKLLRKVSDIHY